jgi:hypothetical protein
MKNDDEEVPVKKAKSFQIKNFWLRWKWVFLKKTRATFLSRT